MTTRVTLQPSFVLHRRFYRETSLLLDIFSEQHGRVSLIAKGVRNNRSAYRALLQPFIPLLISWQGKTDLMTLTSAEPNGLQVPLNGECLLSALYLNELLVYLLHKYDPHPKLYTIYRQTLVELQTLPLEQKVLRLFEKKLLEELGYGIQWQKTFNADVDYRYYPEHGFEPCAKMDDPSFMVFSGKSLLALATDDLSSENVLKDAKRLMRLAFKPLLAGRKLKSRELFLYE